MKPYFYRRLGAVALFAGVITGALWSLRAHADPGFATVTVASAATDPIDHYTLICDGVEMLLQPTDTTVQVIAKDGVSAHCTATVTTITNLGPATSSSTVDFVKPVTPPPAPPVPTLN